MTGSISDIPPSGPDVPSITSLQSILNAISASQSAYNAALNTYNSAQSAYYDALSVVNAAYQLYQQDPSAANRDALAAILADTSIDFQNKLETWNSAQTNLQTCATTYVTDLAYQQIYTAQTGESIVSTQLAEVLAQSTDTSSTLLSLTFPWLSNTQSSTLQTDLDELDPRTSTLLSSFLEYRHSVYQQSSDLRNLSIASGNLALAQMSLDLANGGADGYDAGIWQAAVNTQQTAVTTYTNAVSADQSNVSSKYSSLISAINSYQSVYTDARSTIDATVPTIVSFCQNWNANVVQPAQKAVADAYANSLIQAQSQAQQALNEFEMEFRATNPTLSSAELTAIFTELQSLQEALVAEGVTTTPIEAPDLPASSSSMSMVQLMQILAHAEIMSQDMIRQAASSTAQVNAQRLQYAVAHLTMLASELSSLYDWSSTLMEAEAAYDREIEVLNAANYNTALTSYLAYQSNLSVINSVIDQVNAQITEENDRGQALVTAANSIDPAVIDAVNTTSSTWVNQASSYLINYSHGQTPASPSYPSAATFTPIPLFELLTASDIPDPPYTTYPSSQSLDTTKLAKFNQDIVALEQKIAPFADAVATAIQNITGASAPVTLSNFVTLQGIEVQDPLSGAVAFQTGFALLYLFLTQASLTSKGSEAQATQTQFQQEMLNIILQQGSSIAGTGASIGLGASINASSGSVTAILAQVMNSVVFNQTIQAITQNAAILAGLKVAGTLPNILQRLSNTTMTLAALLEQEGQKPAEELETQTSSDLINAFIQQLALSVSTPGVLEQNAINILSTFPSLSSLSQGQMAQLISGLISIQQMVLLNLTLVLGASIGLTTEQLPTNAFSTAAQAAAALASQFQALGISGTISTQLAAIVAGRDDLQQTLNQMGFDVNTRTMLMAIIASAEGLIPLTSGAPGGPAFLDTLLSELKDNGITMTADINSPEFLRQLVSQLEKKATSEQAAVLETIIPAPAPEGPPEEPNVSLVQQFQEAVASTWTQLNAIFTPAPEPASIPLPTTTPSPIPPTSILSQFITPFETLAPDTQSELTAEVANNPSLSSLPGVSNEQVAALMLATRFGTITSAQATSLLNLAVLQAQMESKGQAFSLSNIETEIITRLFTPTPEELQVLEDAKKADINAPYTNPTSLSPQVLDQVSIAFRTFFNRLQDQTQAADAYKVFAKTIEKLTNFNSVALNYLLDPAKLIMRQFSIITRTAQDRMQQSPITLTG
jgi:hypothetical protein